MLSWQVAQEPTTKLESRLAEANRQHEILQATHASAMETIRLSEAEMVDKSERLEAATVQVILSVQFTGLHNMLNPLWVAHFCRLRSSRN